MVAITDEYRIMRYRKDELQRIITKPFDPKVVSDGDKAPSEDYLEDIWINAGANADVIRQMRQRLQFADVFPAAHSSFEWCVPTPANRRLLLPW